MKLYNSHPVFRVPDVVRAAEFYRDKLGFSFDRFWGEPPCFVMLGRDHIQIFLRAPAAPDPKLPCEGGRDGWHAYIHVKNAQSLRDEFVSKGVPLRRDVEPTFYQMREFEIEDLDGYVLCFGEDITDVEPESPGDCPSD